MIDEKEKATINVPNNLRLTADKPLIINKVKDRSLILSPTVQAGLEKECCKSDFYREGDKFIGKGGFGEVWKVVHKATNCVYVIKVIDKKSIQEQRLVDQMNREIDIMYKINHPHVMKLTNHFEDDDKFYMIMPFASKGQLYSLLRRQVRFDPRTATQYIRETMEAVRYLHSFTPKIIHRDIKPENLLLDDNYRVKLSDFGWSTFKNEGENRKTYCGTPEYLAPEMVRKTGHDHTVDIWSLGVLLFEMLAGYAPFAGFNQNELFSNIKKVKINWPDDFPPLAKNLVSKILKLNPSERISLEEMSKHSWFEKHPPLRPILTNYLTDEKQILESHLINVTPDSVKDVLKEIVLPELKNKCLKPRNRKNSLDTGELKTMITHFQNEADKISKENSDIKIKLSLYEAELKTLRIDNLKYKEIEKSQLTEQLKQLNDELDKYRIMNNERLALITEIEEKSNEIIELKNQNLNYENEKINTKRIILNLREKQSEYEKNQKESEIKIESLTSKLFEQTQSIESIDLKYQKKIEILQNSMFTDETEDYGISSLVQIVSDDVDDLQSNFKNKIDLIKENIDTFTSEYKIRESALGDLLDNYIYKNVQLIMGKLKISIADDIKRSKDNNNSDQKKADMIDWQKKQINELQQFKSKTMINEIKISQMEDEMRLIREKVASRETMKSLLSKIAEDNEEEVTELNTEVTFLKAKMFDIDRFITEHCKDDTFKYGYKKTYNQKKSNSK